MWCKYFPSQFLVRFYGQTCKQRGTQTSRSIQRKWHAKRIYARTRSRRVGIVSCLMVWFWCARTPDNCRFSNRLPFTFLARSNSTNENIRSTSRGSYKIYIVDHIKHIYDWVFAARIWRPSIGRQRVGAFCITFELLLVYLKFLFVRTLFGLHAENHLKRGHQVLFLVSWAALFKKGNFESRSWRSLLWMEHVADAVMSLTRCYKDREKIDSYR